MEKTIRLDWYEQDGALVLCHDQEVARVWRASSTAWAYSQRAILVQDAEGEVWFWTLPLDAVVVESLDAAMEAVKALMWRAAKNGAVVVFSH